MIATVSLMVSNWSFSSKDFSFAWKAAFLSCLRFSKDGKVVFIVPLAVIVVASAAVY